MEPKSNPKIDIMNKRHFLLYYDYRTKEITKTIPRTWAKANQGHFPKFDFKKLHPTDQIIERYLERYYEFKRVEEADFVLIYNFSQTFPTIRGRSFIQ
jgi:hypothetical protein